MSLSAKLAALETAKPRKFKDWLLLSQPEEIALVLSYVRNPNVAPDTLAVTLRAEGIPITRDTILKYRSEAQ